MYVLYKWVRLELRVDCPVDLNSYLHVSDGMDDNVLSTNRDGDVYVTESICQRGIELAIRYIVLSTFPQSIARLGGFLRFGKPARREPASYGFYVNAATKQANRL
jgi:hypothetical protein